MNAASEVTNRKLPRSVPNEYLESDQTGNPNSRWKVFFTDDDHEKKTLSTSPKVKNLRQRDKDGGLHTAGHDVDDRNKRVRFPFADSVRLQCPVDT